MFGECVHSCGSAPQGTNFTRSLTRAVTRYPRTFTNKKERFLDLPGEETIPKSSGMAATLRRSLR